jgi:hypothetical protein
MGSKDDAKSKKKDEKAAATAEQEYIIQPTLARYIDRKDLEKLLLRTFKKAITAYVSRLLYDFGETTFWWLIYYSVHRITTKSLGIQPRAS